ncbi:MAG TPA: response regulator [Kofleriaceae bacterium]
MTDEDKRRDSREAVTLFVEYDGADDLVGDFTENLSSGGTFVATNRDLPIGTRVQLVLSFPGLLEPISIEGVVRWKRHTNDAEGDAGAGIEFAEGPARDVLASIVDRVRNRDPKMVSRLFRVLVVEDNKHVAQLITEGLRGSSRRDFGGVSFVFRSAEDGRAAVEILRREKFDALIIDVYLPIVDGPRVIQQARTELGLVELPIIAVSAGGDAARRSALEAGANIFLDKPMRLRQVIDTMQRLLTT